MIRFMAPDLPALSGGLKVIYGLARQLDQAGRPACVWHGTPGHTVPGLDGTAPVETGPTLRFEAGDVLVMPEVGGTKWSTLNPDVPVVMLVQGIDFLFTDADFLHPLEGAYPGWPQATAAIGVSQVIEEYLHSLTPGLPVHRVPVAIDTDLFRPGTKERLVGFMPRRRPEDLMGTVQLLHRHGRLQEWRLLPIDGLTPDGVAQALGRCAIFLSGGEREGFGLPGAEAMAAGAYVLGWTGHGAREYMLPGLATAVDDSDVVGLAAAVEEAMDLFDHDRSTYDARARRARDLIEERYHEKVQREALAEAFAALLADGSPTPLPRSVDVHHYATRAPSAAPAARAYVAARTLGGRVKRGMAARLTR